MYHAILTFCSFGASLRTRLGRNSFGSTPWLTATKRSESCRATRWSHACSKQHALHRHTSHTTYVQNSRQRPKQLKLERYTNNIPEVATFPAVIKLRQKCYKQRNIACLTLAAMSSASCSSARQRDVSRLSDVMLAEAVPAGAAAALLALHWPMRRCKASSSALHSSSSWRYVCRWWHKTGNNSCVLPASDILRK